MTLVKLLHGYDRIPMSVIKQSINLISIHIAHIMNLSINHGIVPDEMKIARVTPLFKSGDYGTFTNYRPVSILPSFSKFLEPIIYNRLINYIDKNRILCDTTSAVWIQKAALDIFSSDRYL